MKFLNRFFDFYINSSIHVALSVYALVSITELYLKLPSHEALECFIFYGTITGYNFVKYAGVAKLHHRSLTNNLKIIQIFSLICFLLTIYYGFQLNVKTLIFFIPFGLLTLLYALPVFKGFVKNLRNIPSVKILIIALVWSGVTVLLPFFNTEKNICLELVFTFIQRFLFVVVLTLPFDIRDFQFDKKELQTIPQLIGVKHTKKLGFILLVITLVIEFFIAPSSNFKSVFLIVFILLLILLQRATIYQKKYYASFFVEAVPVFWYILLLIFNKFAI